MHKYFLLTLYNLIFIQNNKYKLSLMNNIGSINQEKKEKRERKNKKKFPE